MLLLFTSIATESVTQVALSMNKYLNLPPLVPNLTGFDQITALGITFNNTLSSGPHVNLITAKAATSFCALKTLKATV